MLHTKPDKPWIPQKSLELVVGQDRELLPLPGEVLPEPPSKEPVAVLGEARLRHWEELTCVAYSPDGKTLAGGGGSRGLAVVRLWDATEFSERDVLRVESEAEDGHYSGLVVALAYAPDGKRLAARCDNGTVCLWNVGRSGVTLWAKLEGDSQGAVAFTKDGKTLAVGCGNGRVQLWDLARRQPSVKDVLKGLVEAVGDVAYSADGKELAAVDDGGGLGLWSVIADEVKELPLKRQLAEPLSVGPKNSKSKAPKPKVRGCARVAFSPDGKVLAVLHDRCLRVWGREGEHLRQLGEWQERGHFVFAPSGHLLYDDRGNKCRWDDHVSMTAACQLHGPACFRPDGKAVGYVCADERRICVQNYEDEHSISLELIHPTGHATAVLSVAFLPGDKSAMTLAADGLRQWDLAPSRAAAKPVRDSVPDGVRWVILDPKAGLLALLDRDVKLHVLERLAAEGTEVSVPFDDTAGERMGRRPVVFAGDGQKLAIGNLDGTIHVWGTGWTAPKKRRVLKWHETAVSALAYPGPGQRLLSGDEKGNVILWEMSEEMPAVVAGRWKAGSGRVTWLEALDAGYRVGTVEGDRLRVWRMAYGDAELKLVHEAVLQGKKESGSILFSPDGGMAAAVEGGDHVAVWSATTGKRLVTWQFSGNVNDIAFSPGGQYLLTANANGTASLFQLRHPSEPSQAISRRER